MGFGLKVAGLRLCVVGLGFLGFGLRVQGFWGFGPRVQDLGRIVWGLGPLVYRVLGNESLQRLLGLRAQASGYLRLAGSLRARQEAPGGLFLFFESPCFTHTRHPKP